MKLKILLLIICFITPLKSATHKKLNITVAGTGYVGLVLGAALAEFDHQVTCVDIDKGKIEQLNNGIMPIYEPGLAELVKKNKERNLLTFSHDVLSALKDADVIFLAVGTPMMADGRADISAVLAVTENIAATLQDNKYRIICLKSTVPIGTAEKVKNILNRRCNPATFDVVSNPEFLREGSAVKDFMEPDRVVFGLDSEKALSIMNDIYAPLFQHAVPFFITDNTTAETIKYASNAFLAVKISYINEIANLCEKTGANVFDVAKGMGLDSRIGNKFLTPGPGFGGSCFPKDTHALLKKAEEFHVELKVVDAALKANDFQKKNVVTKLCNLIGDDLSGKTIAILGLAFKANTDDVRESAAIDVIYGLQKKGAVIRAYDPLAMHTMKKVIPDIYYAPSANDALQNADAAIILTEWDEFKKLNTAHAVTRTHPLPILDTRNILGKN